MTTILAIIAGVIGLATIFFRWWLNPSRQLYAELDKIDKQLKVWYRKRDEAMIKNKVDELTIAISTIKDLLQHRITILARINNIKK